jgi:Uma2 family endonuclease
MAVTRHGLTLDEFLALPEEKPALEYVDGAIRQKVAPQAQHSVLQTLLAEWLNGYARPRKLGLALPELRTVFGGRAHVPDVVFCLREQIPRDARGRIWGNVTVPPAIVVQIASPGQTRRQLSDDCAWYVAHGVALALLVLPDAEEIVAYAPGQPPRTLRGADRLDFGAALPGYALVVGDLFAAARPDW